MTSRSSTSVPIEQFECIGETPPPRHAGTSPLLSGLALLTGICAHERDRLRPLVSPRTCSGVQTVRHRFTPASSGPRNKSGVTPGGKDGRCEHAVIRASAGGVGVHRAFPTGRHGRTCSGHPRLAASRCGPGGGRGGGGTWMAGTSPAMTEGGMPESRISCPGSRNPPETRLCSSLSPGPRPPKPDSSGTSPGMTRKAVRLGRPSQPTRSHTNFKIGTLGHFPTGRGRTRLRRPPHPGPLPAGERESRGAAATSSSSPLPLAGGAGGGWTGRPDPIERIRFTWNRSRRAPASPLARHARTCSGHDGVGNSGAAQRPRTGRRFNLKRIGSSVGKRPDLCKLPSIGLTGNAPPGGA